MKTHEMKLREAPFYMIASGKKTVELRLYDEKRRTVSVGDRITFTLADKEERVTCTVTALHCFPSFAELYAHLPLLSCGYTEETVSDASPEDMRKYYSAEEESAYGVIGIEISLLCSDAE